MGLEKVTYVDGSTVITAQNLNAIQDSIIDLEASRTVPSNVRNAIYTLLENAAYATTGLEDEIAVVEAWAEEVTSLTLSASTLSLNNDVPQTITATTVPIGATVTWSSSNNSVATVSDGIVTGVSNGSCVITASAGELVATCDVTVVGFVELVSISAVYTQSGTVYDIDSVDSLKADLVVTATYSDSSTETIPSTDYTLSGTLTVGTSTITVAYGGKTDTFTVTVSTTVLYELSSTFTSSGSEYINTNVKYPTDGTITIAIEFTITTFAQYNTSSPIDYVFGNRTSVTNTYLSLQDQIKTTTTYLWGIGISYSNGNNLVAANDVVRMVGIFTLSNNGANASISSSLKNVTKNTNRTFSNTYTASGGTSFSDEYIFLGNAYDNTGFIGNISKFIIDNATWDSTQINAFLAGE